MRLSDWRVLTLLVLACVLLAPLRLPAAASAEAPPSKPGAEPFTPPKSALAWDSEMKTFKVKEGQTNLNFSFSVTNLSQSDVTIKKVHPSCGCTVVKMPAQPWVLAPGAHDTMNVAVDLRGKYGSLVKSILVESSAGFKSLLVKIDVPGQPGNIPTSNVPTSAMMARAQNIRVALTDRQAVLKDDCARCHAAPAEGKTGQALYQAVCAVCHEAAHRASMVPDLRHPRVVPDAPVRDAGFWRQWITSGKEGTLMPGFGKQIEGGPLSDQQITSLVEYLDQNFPKGPSRASTPPGK